MATEAEMKVSLVVVNYNTAGLVDQLLTSVGSAADEVVVVDNASPQGGVEQIADRHPGAQIIRMATNVGYGAGANEGARSCTSDVLVVANPDVHITRQGLRDLAAIVASGRAAIAAPRFVDTADATIRSSHYREPGLLTTLFEQCGPFAAACSRIRPGWHPTLRPASEHDHDHDALHLLGALLAIDMASFRRVGGFDESFFLYREETDLCRRIRDEGGRVRHVSAVTAIHEGDASSQDAVTVAVRPASVRSHYHYIRKHSGPPAAIVAWIFGLLGGVSWVVVGRHRAWARASVRSHLALLRLRHPIRHIPLDIDRSATDTVRASE